MMKRLIGFAFGLLLSSAAVAQTTTREYLTNGLTECAAANTPIVGNGANAQAKCHASGALGSAAFANTGTSGATIGLLSTANTHSATQTFAAIVATTLNGNTFSTGTGTLTLGASKTATISNTLTFTGTDGSSVAFGAGGTVGPVGYAATGQVPGIATNTSASAGNVGEYLESTVAIGSAVSLTTGVAANMTSISLTAGEWDVAGVITYNVGGATVTTIVTQGTNSTSATFGGDGSYTQLGFTTAAGGSPGSWIMPTFRYLLSGTTTIYAVGRSSFSGGASAIYGHLRARRVR